MVRFFVLGVKEQATEAAEHADKLIGLQARYRELLLARRATANAIALVDALFDNPLVSSRRAQEVLGVSAPTARSAIRTLEEQGILHEITGRSWGKVYRAEEIYACLRGD